MKTAMLIVFLGCVCVVLIPFYAEIQRWSFEAGRWVTSGLRKVRARRLFLLGWERRLQYAPQQVPYGDARFIPLARIKHESNPWFVAGTRCDRIGPLLATEDFEELWRSCGR